MSILDKTTATKSEDQYIKEKKLVHNVWNVLWLYFSSGKVKNNLSVMPKVNKYTLIFD